MDTSYHWSQYAACGGNEDPDMWYPELARKGVPTAQQIAEKEDRVDAAKAVCARCPVRRACLEQALAEEGGRWGRSGIRGGLDADERVRLVKTRNERVRKAQLKEAKEAA